MKVVIMNSGCGSHAYLLIFFPSAFVLMQQI